MIGGMSWESSIEYYRIINETVREELGGLHSAKSVMYSVDFAEIESLQHQEKWTEATALMVDGAKRVEAGGADFIVICTNTMHRMADEVQQQIQVPLLHIADVTAHEIKSQGMEKIGLLGTRFTMEEQFYKGRLVDQHGLQVLVPQLGERAQIHEIIYSELCLGETKATSRSRFKAVIEGLVDQGAQGIILGCTEIGLLVSQADSQVPLFDTTAIHAQGAAKRALAGNG